MCGRYTLTEVEGVGEFFEINERPELFARFNIAPSQPIPVVRLEDTERKLAEMTWGLSRTTGGDGLLINARSESVDRKPSFRRAFETGQRCLVPADGFFEWRRDGAKRRPFYFQLARGGLFAFAGIWADGEPETRPRCAILTTQPNELVSEIHDRMPVILPPSCFNTWLSRSTDVGTLKSLFHHLASSEMTSREVDTFVNRAQNEGPGCVAEPQRKSETGWLF